MRKFVEPDVADNPLYHDTWKLLKKYRDVVWSLELSVQHVRTKFEIEYGTSIEDFLDSVYLAGADLAGSDIEHHAKCIERSHKMLKLLDSAVELLRTKHKNGEAYYWLLYYSFLSPQQLKNVEEIIETLPLDHGVRPSCIKLCRLQFRDAGHHRCVCQWGCGADYLDFGSHPRLELPKTSVRGSRTVCAARCTGLHGSRGFFYGRQPNHSKHLEILVPDAWRSNFPIGHERLVPAPVHKHGGVLPCEPAFVVRRSYP